jgi:hypothetical protein
VYFIIDGINLTTHALDVWFWDKVAECPTIRRITIANSTIENNTDHYHNLHSIIVTMNLEMLSFVDCDINVPTLVN